MTPFKACPNAAAGDLIVKPGHQDRSLRNEVPLITRVFFLPEGNQPVFSNILVHPEWIVVLVLPYIVEKVLYRVGKGRKRKRFINTFEKQDRIFCCPVIAPLEGYGGISIFQPGILDSRERFRYIHQLRIGHRFEVVVFITGPKKPVEGRVRIEVQLDRCRFELGEELFHGSHLHVRYCLRSN